MNTQTYTLITGASSGIGMEFAKIAASSGRNVVLVARRKDKLTELADNLTRQHGIQTEVVALDLSEAKAAQSLYSFLADKNISVDTLINNAGFGDYGTFVATDRQTQLSMINLNIQSLTELTHLFLPAMVKAGHGRILNVASVAAFLPGPLMSVYFATKAYVLSFSEALAEELRGSGVTVTCLAPGSTKTDFGENAQVSKTHSTRTSCVTAAQVAAYGWASMLNGKTVAIHGLNNRLAVFLQRFLPRRTVAKLVHRMQK